MNLIHGCGIPLLPVLEQKKAWEKSKASVFAMILILGFIVGLYFQSVLIPYVNVIQIQPSNHNFYLNNWLKTCMQFNQKWNWQRSTSLPKNKMRDRERVYGTFIYVCLYSAIDYRTSETHNSTKQVSLKHTKSQSSAWILTHTKSIGTTRKRERLIQIS